MRMNGLLAPHGTVPEEARRDSGSLEIGATDSCELGSEPRPSGRAASTFNR